jgi:hypothetical protein
MAFHSTNAPKIHDCTRKWQKPGGNLGESKMNSSSYQNFAARSDAAAPIRRPNGRRERQGAD